MYRYCGICRSYYRYGDRSVHGKSGGSHDKGNEQYVGGFLSVYGDSDIDGKRNAPLSFAGIGRNLYADSGKRCGFSYRQIVGDNADVFEGLYFNRI